MKMLKMYEHLFQPIVEFLSEKGFDTTVEPVVHKATKMKYIKIHIHNSKIGNIKIRKSINDHQFYYIHSNDLLNIEELFKVLNDIL